MSGKAVLSPFQKEKLEYYFKFFDENRDSYIETTDFPLVLKRILDFTKWDEHDRNTLACEEVHRTFYEALAEKADINEDHMVSMDEWLEFWSRITHSCMGMGDFPLWVQYLPEVLFSIVDSKGDKEIDVEELAHFYKNFVQIRSDNVQELSQKAYDAMTDKGRYPLNLETYKQMFANFLLGRNKYGPGRFIFGCFEHTAAEDFHIQWLSPEDK